MSYYFILPDCDEYVWVHVEEAEKRKNPRGKGGVPHQRKRVPVKVKVCTCESKIGTVLHDHHGPLVDPHQTIMVGSTYIFYIVNLFMKVPFKTDHRSWKEIESEKKQLLMNYCCWRPHQKIKVGSLSLSFKKVPFKTRPGKAKRTTIDCLLLLKASPEDECGVIVFII